VSGNRRNANRVTRGAFVAGALATALPMRVIAQSAAAIRIGCTAGDSYSEGLIAQDYGFWQRAGLDVTMQILGNGAAVAGAVAGGALDVGISSPVTLAAGFERGVPFRILCSGGLYNPDEGALVVLTDSPVHSGKDLTGKTVGVSALNDMNAVTLQAWIDQTGGDASSVKLVEIPFSAMGAALRRGEIAAAPLSEPMLSAVKREGGVRILMPHLFGVNGTSFALGTWFSTDAWIRANPDLARRIVTTIYATGKWANAHPDEVCATIAKYAKLDLAVVKTMARAPYGESLTPAMLQTAFDNAYKYKVLPRPIDAATMIATP
jgi:NitT/TauT family transport system substrate-binding protein